MKTIKFRGRVPDSDKRDGGRIVYGSLVEYDFGIYKFWINPLVDNRNYPVEPDSVAQLIGYDVDGKEVYEGDTLIDILGNEYTARIRIELTCEDRRSTLRGKAYAGTVDNLKLKE